MHPEVVENAIILHDSAVAHLADATDNVLWQWGVGNFATPPYSPAISPSDYNMIPKLKQPLCGQWLAMTEGILTVISSEVLESSMSYDANGVHHLPHHWQQTADNLGYYCEGC
jgi:hypothetical protein